MSSLRAWVFLIAGAEAAAFALGGAVAMSGAPTWSAFAAVACVEIPALCTAQWAVLRHRVPGLRWWSWTLATGSVAAATWSAAIAFTSAGEGSGAAAEPAVWLQAAGYIALGAAAGLLMGAAQWVVLRRHVAPGLWVIWSGAAWAAGMPASSLITGSVPAGAGIWAGLAFGAVGGAAMGALVALVLWPGVVRLRPLSSGTDSRRVAA